MPPVPGVDLAAYCSKVEERFANPKIGDTIRRLCLDGSNRQPKFIVPTIRAALESGRASRAGWRWCRLYGAATASARPIPAPSLRPTTPAGTACRRRPAPRITDPGAWLGMGDIYGEVGAAPGLRMAFAEALETVREAGAREALTRYLAGAIRPA